MNDKIINGIDVSEYFIDVVDEGGGTIGYKLLPNSERLLVEKIFEQNQQLKRLQKENEQLKAENERLKAKQIGSTGFICDCEQNEKYRQTLQEIKAIAEKNIFLKPEILTLKGDIGYIQNEVAVAILQILTKAESEEE